MKIDDAIKREMTVLESRLSDRTLPEAEHDRIRARLIDLRRQITGVPNPEELAEILKRIETLEAAVKTLEDFIVKRPTDRSFPVEQTARDCCPSHEDRPKRGRPPVKKGGPVSTDFENFLDGSTD